ncbi:hypothetical protein B0T14DRAFT_510289 [Immersiella caudata]|uniref:Uncharacterized protein n=1 Tax=Immersiella caudata TaxID=314043 RepID=A0AA40C711_9PEZI|nr:hypothetical protein B0T14DRAFT_510289 [Immersiella caudata]
MTCRNIQYFPILARIILRNRFYIPLNKFLGSGSDQLFGCWQACWSVAGGSTRRRGQPGHNMESQGWKLGRTYVGRMDRPPRTTTTTTTTVLRKPVLFGCHKVRPPAWTAATTTGSSSYRTGRSRQSLLETHLFDVGVAMRQRQVSTDEVLSSALMHSCRVRASPLGPNHRALCKGGGRGCVSALPCLSSRSPSVFGEIGCGLVARTRP